MPGEMQPPSHASSNAASVSWTGGFLVLSFAVSCVGAFTTIELLHRRSNYKGWIKCAQTFACSVAFGVNCVWCMAFVANNALVLGEGHPAEQLYYAPSHIAASVMVPLAASCVAFVVADLRFRSTMSHVVSLIASGIIMGLAVVGVHYVANFGIKNYELTYEPAFVGGAIVIACTACTGILFVVFRLQDRLLSTVEWRMICALLLAAAVTSMHYEAMMGTTYSKISDEATAHSQRQCTLSVALAICACSVFADAALFVYSHRRHKRLAGRALQVVLACARFDHEGRIMVTREGVLPCRKITSKGNERAFDDDFNSSHSAFQWIFRLSNDWKSIVPWLRAIRGHLQASSAQHASDRDSVGSDASSVTKTLDSCQDYSIFFRESFCMAAESLADDLRISVLDLGKLFDTVMISGSRDSFSLKRRPRLRLSLFRRHFNQNDIENGAGVVDIFGKGQVLFLVKRTERKDLPKFQSMGYRFLPVDKIVPTFAEIMQVPQAYLHDHLVRARASALDLDAYKKQPTGVYLACFAVKPSIAKREWEVLVYKSQTHKLPSVPLWSLPRMSERQGFVDALDGKSVVACLAHVQQRLASLNSDEEAFAKAFKRAILGLKEHIGEPFFQSATLSSTVAQVPLSDAKGAGASCRVLCFHIIPDIHDCTIRNSDRFEYIPLTFLKCFHRTLDNAGPDSEFREHVRKEFVKRYGEPLLRTDSMHTGVGSSLDDRPNEPQQRPQWRRSRRWTATPIISFRSLTSSMYSTSTSGFHDSTKYVGDVASFSASSRSLSSPAMTADSNFSQAADKPDSGGAIRGTPANSQVALVPKHEEQVESPIGVERTFVDDMFAIATARWAKR